VASAQDASGPTQDVPELKPIDHYAGVWDVYFGDAPLEDRKPDGTATAKWVLQGRFLEQMGDLEPGESGLAFELKTLWTWDAQKKSYRSWTFASTGYAIQADATWDAGKKTMTSIAEDPSTGNTITTTARFHEPGVETWKIVTTDRTGRGVGEISGRNVKRDQKP
jgi:hypothetical protein